MPNKLNDNDTVFDGYMHRRYDEKLDGWRNEIPNLDDYLCAQVAHDVLAMFNELREAKRRIWQLEKQLSIYTGEIKNV
jgi:hypothetical protein